MDLAVSKEMELRVEMPRLQELISQAQRTLNVSSERFGLDILFYYNKILNELSVPRRWKIANALCLS